mgnify:FL=1
MARFSFIGNGEALVNEVALRNIKIGTAFETLSRHTKLGYETKVNILAKDFNLSPHTIRNIISAVSPKDPNGGNFK